VDERSREVERRLELPLLAFALLTIPAIALDQPDVSEPWNAIGVALNWAIWLAFVAEVVIMLRVVPDRRRWLRDHPLDLAIVLLTPPFLPPSLQAHGCSACYACCGLYGPGRSRGACSRQKACATQAC
jgi:voltage-gated potassium channel